MACGDVIIEMTGTMTIVITQMRPMALAVKMLSLKAGDATNEGTTLFIQNL